MRTLITFVFFLLFFVAGFSQTDSTEVLYRVVTLEGNEFLGTKQQETADTVYLMTNNLGLLKIPQNQVKKMQLLEGEFRNGDEFWPNNPQSSRYFFAPNGYGLKKGEGYYQNLMVFYNQASYGFNDYFTMGVGTVPVFFAGISTPVWVTPKVSIPIIKEKLNAGAGVFAGTLLGQDTDLPLFGIGYGVLTYGSRDNNINLGVGYGFADGDWTANPLFNIGFMIRMSRRTYLVSENWILPFDGTYGLITLGGRTVWPQISLDYGIMIPAGIGTVIGIPWIGLAVPFEATIE